MYQPLLNLLSYQKARSLLPEANIRSLFFLFSLGVQNEFTLRVSTSLSRAVAEAPISMNPFLYTWPNKTRLRKLYVALKVRQKSSNSGSRCQVWRPRPKNKKPISRPSFCLTELSFAVLCVYLPSSLALLCSTP